MPQLQGMTRPKSEQFVDLNVDIRAANPVDTPTGSQHRYVLKNVTPSPYGFANCTWTTADGNVVVGGAGLPDLRPGDGVAGTGIPVGAFVQTKVDNNNFVLSAVPTQAGANSTLNFTPPTFDATVAIVEQPISGSGSTVTMDQPRIYLLDGSQAFDGDRDGIDEAVIADAVNASKPLTKLPTSIDLNGFLLKARVAQTNS